VHELAERTRDVRHEVELLRDEFMAQVPAHSGYAIAAMVGLVLSIATLLSNPAILTITASIVLMTGLFFFSRLIYYLELVAITADILGLNGESRSSYFAKTIGLQSEVLKESGVTGVVFEEYAARRSGRGLYNYGRLKRFFLWVASLLRRILNQRNI